MITDPKLLIAVFKRQIANLFHRMQRIFLHTNQYDIGILQKVAAQLFITDWLSRYNHKIEMKKYQTCVLPSMQQTHAWTYQNTCQQRR